MLIGSSLLFSIGGTLLLMQFLGEGLNRTSLAGFIIAMGMLVDNAIVVTDNAQQAMLRGVARRRAVVDGANAPRWSLLGATLIAIFSFLPLYLAPSSVAEIVKPLFVVLALSLLLSWVLALTQTPLFGDFMLRVNPAAHDPYDTKFYRAFDRLLAALLRWRWGVVAGVVALFAAALAVMGLMPQNFFPSLDKPYFRADVLLPEGYNIRDTERNLRTMEEWLHAQPEVKTVSVTMGSTPPRYYLASSSVSLRPTSGNILVELHDKGQTEAVEARFNAYVRAMCPDVWLRSSLFKLSPVPDAAIEFGFIGDDIDTLRRLTQAAEEIMWRTAGTVNIRNSWGNRVPTWLPLYSQMKGQRIGVTRSQMAQGITIATQGLPPRRIPRGRPVHADPSEGREYRHLQPHQPAGTADFHPRRQGLLHRAGDRRLPLRIPRRSGETLQPSAGHEGAVRPRPRGQHHAALRCAAGFGSARRGAPRRVFDEGFRRAGEPAGIQLGPGQVYAP